MPPLYQDLVPTSAETRVLHTFSFCRLMNWFHWLFTFSPKYHIRIVQPPISHVIIHYPPLSIFITLSLLLYSIFYPSYTIIQRMIYTLNTYTPTYTPSSSFFFYFSFCVSRPPLDRYYNKHAKWALWRNQIRS